MTDGRSGWRRHGPLLLRLAALAAIAFWLLRATDLADLGNALRRIPAAAVGIALLLGGANLVVATFRWGLVMRAFGARALPPFGTVLRLFLVGLFYNTFVPGSVGGDVLRGVLSQRVFERPTASYVVVVVERLVGLSALAVVFLAGVAASPDLVDVSAALPWVAGLAALGLVVLAAARISGRLARWWSLVPPVEDAGRLIGAFALSFVGHLINVTIFWVLARGLDLPLGPLQLVVVVPLALVAAVVPIAVAGIGPREAALVGLLGLLGVAEAEALAMSLGYAAVLLAMAGSGGVLQLLGRGAGITGPAPPSGSDTSRSSGAGPPPG